MKESSKKHSWAELIVPALAFGYGFYAFLEQYLAGTRSSTLIYSAMLVVPLIACSIILVIRFFIQKIAVKQISFQEGRATEFKNYKRPALLLLGTIIALALFDLLGLIASLSIFLIASLWWLGIRSPVKVLSICGVVMGLVYYVFGVWLKLSLPRGIIIELLFK